MSRSGNVEEILRRAKALEREYDWVKATELHEQVLGLVENKDFLKRGETQERIGYCFYRGAFQAETQEEFRRRIGLSTEAYEEAANILERLEGSQKRARVNRCNAMAIYNRSWLAEGSSERKALLDMCWKLEKEALKAFEGIGDRLGYGKLCNDLLQCLYNRSRIEWDRQQLNRIVEEAVAYGETTIEALSNARSEQELARAYSLTSLHCYYGANVTELEEKKKEFSQKCLSYAKRALNLSEKVGDRFIISLSNWAATRAFHFSGDMASSLEHAEKMLQKGMATQDNFVKGVACYRLAAITNWMMAIEEDPDKKRQGYTKAIRYAEDAVRHLRITANDYFIASTPLTANYIDRSIEVETDREEKRICLERAVETGRKSLEHAERSGSPDAIGQNLHELSRALLFLSNMKTNVGEKKRLLEEASKHRRSYIKIVEKVYPSNYWVYGVGQNYQALIGAELAKVELDKESRRGLLEEAASNMGNCLRLCEKWAKLHPQTRIFAILGEYYDRFGAILNQLYRLTEDKEVFERTIEAYGKAADMYSKVELPSRLAEAHWSVAKLYDQAGEYVQASERFKSAADAYKASGEKIQRLNDFYSDYATYLQAWIEIEKARYHHSKLEYGQAKKHYENAASLHESSKSWKYLTSNYLAWAEIEHAEDLSRNEQSQRTIKAFQKASRLFREAKRTLQAQLDKIENADENGLAKRLIGASDIRREYCLGRIALEEAKILDRQGDHAASSRRYGSAAGKFQRMIAAMERESDRKELKPIVCLCQAWQMMTRAEAESSPDLYLEASKLFDEAKEHSFSEKAKVLALGHSSFCMALEAGTKFEAIRDMKLYSAATRYLESSGSYYVRAGFKIASEYVKATQRLFDAYVYIDDAKGETDPEKKARYYMMAEKILQASTGSYIKAKHPEKSEQVQRLLEKVREERELAVSLSEILHAPTITSSTASFFTPTPSEESAVGLERFEHAHVQGKLIPRRKEIRVGEDLDLEIEMVNAGKAPASLIRVEEIIPKGFQIRKVPAVCRVEDSSLNMKGKRLNPLKTEEVKLALQPRIKGTFLLKPRILFADETGKYGSHEPEPVTITVKELGIRGWIKGEK